MSRTQLYVVDLASMDVEDAGLVGLSAGQPLDLPDGVTEHLGSILTVGDDGARHHLYGDTDTQT